jgi:hypothetical protein
MAIKYTNNIFLTYVLNVCIIYQPFPIQGPPKFTQIGIFGLKIYHLATLHRSEIFVQFWNEQNLKTAMTLVAALPQENGWSLAIEI